MIHIKSRREIGMMRQAGQIVADVHKLMKELVRPGVSTWELDKEAEALIRSRGAKPTFKGYHEFPGTLCVSINQVVVHGIPNKNHKLKEGDIIGIDCGATLNGYIGDSAWTYAVGKVDPRLTQLMEVTEASLWAAIQAAKVGGRISDIGRAVEGVVNPYGYGIVRDFCGHGVGTSLHEDPQVPNYSERDKGQRMREGLCIAIEPMINMGTYETKLLSDGWTVVTLDGKASAHFEHSIAVLPEGPYILTALNEEIATRFQQRAEQASPSATQSSVV
ncbi:MAG: type I methionyl aminopeptidase [Myxococcota bacterium]